MQEIIFQAGIILFSLMVIPAFWSYKIVLLKNNKWWQYSWTGHALVLSIVFLLILNLRGIAVGWLGLISAILLIVTGLGLLLLNLGYFIENRKMRKDEYIKWYIVLPTHFIMFIVAIAILKFIHLNIFDLVLSYIFLFLYFIFMYGKLDSPWILYYPSKFSKEKRASYIHNALVVIYIFVPIIIFLK